MLQTLPFITTKGSSNLEQSSPANQDQGQTNQEKEDQERNQPRQQEWSMEGNKSAVCSNSRLHKAQKTETRAMRILS